MVERERVLAEERDVAHGANGFYNLRLVEVSSSALRIEVELVIFFDFVPHEHDPKIIWTAAERDTFSAEWVRQITASWNQADHATHDGKVFSLVFRCDLRTVANETQWQARVYKMKTRGDFRTSAVGRGTYANRYDAAFDSNDDQLKPIGDKTQTAMIHEIGHMVGNPDEYKSGSPHVADRASIMNGGSTVRDRHLDHFIAWARRQIAGPFRETRIMAIDAALQLLNSLGSATSVAAEIEAVEGWRDQLTPATGIRFTVRRRDDRRVIPIEDVDPAAFEALEIVFEEGQSVSDERVWRPLSSRALESLFVE